MYPLFAPPSQSQAPFPPGIIPAFLVFPRVQSASVLRGKPADGRQPFPSFYPNFRLAKDRRDRTGQKLLYFFPRASRVLPQRSSVGLAGRFYREECRGVSRRMPRLFAKRREALHFIHQKSCGEVRPDLWFSDPIFFG